MVRSNVSSTAANGQFMGTRMFGLSGPSGGYLVVGESWHDSHGYVTSATVYSASFKPGSQVRYLMIRPAVAVWTSGWLPA